METSMGIPQKILKELPYDPEMPLLNICPQEMKSESQRDYCIFVITAARYPTYVIDLHVHHQVSG
jgi:hypothetical protein